MKFKSATKKETITTTNNIRAKKLRMQSLPIAVLALAAIVAPGSATAASSSAFGISVQFTVGNSSTGVRVFDSAQGTTPSGLNKHSYNQSVPLAEVNQVLNIVGGPAPVPALFIDASQLQANVEGAFGVDTLSSAGDATLHTVNLSLNLNPPPPNFLALAAPRPLLTVSASGVTSHAGYSDQVPLPPVVDGSASFVDLTVSGSWFGNQILTFSGSAPKNKILYQSPTVTSTDVPAIVITLNREIALSLINCQVAPLGWCPVTTTGTSTEALSIRLHNVNLDGQVVSGEIIVGYSSAQ